MDKNDRSVEINMSGIQIAGVGGLGMVIVALVMAMEIVEARWLLVTGVAGGVALAVALVMIYATRGHSDSPRPGSPKRSEHRVSRARRPGTHENRVGEVAI